MTAPGSLPRRVILLAHTHWDREWYEPLPVFQKLLVEMMDALLGILTAEPRFRHFHLDGQAALVDDYLALRPEREPELRGLVEAGRLSVGPWFTQADEFLCSGETVIRNLEWGRAWAERLGVPEPVGGPWAGYLPDQFGHIGQMPQLLRHAGFTRAVVLRGVPAQIDRGAFRWRSPDGSEVLAEYLMHGYYLGADLHEHMASPEVMAAELQRIATIAGSISDRDVVLIQVGSDHTSPVSRLAQAVAEAAPLTGMEVAFGSLAEFLAAAGSAAPPAGVAAPPAEPVWTGELRAASHWPLLPGVYATRPHQKRRRAQLEARLERYAEPLAALVPGVSWPAAALDEAWRRMLWNAAHDSVYGCSHDQVARDVDARHDEVAAILDGVIGEAAGALASTAGGLGGTLRWNPSPFEREAIPGLGWVVVAEGSSGPGAPPADPVPVRLLVDGTSIVLDDSIVLTLTDEDDVGDLYTFCPPEAGAPAGPTGIEDRGEGRVRVVFPDVTVDLSVTRHTAEPLARIEGRIDNRRPDHRLRLWIDLGTAPSRSTALAPFEVVDRPLVGEGYADEVGSPTWPARGAVLAGETALLAEGVVEYEVSGARLGVTLLRAVGVIARPTVATRSVQAGPATPTPEAQCLGETRFSLGVWQGARRDGLVEAWERFALPILEVPVPGGGPGPVAGRLLDIADAHLSAIRRQADGGLEVRIWNDRPEPRRTRVAGRPIDLEGARIETIRPR